MKHLVRIVVKEAGSYFTLSCHDPRSNRFIRAGKFTKQTLPDGIRALKSKIERAGHRAEVYTSTSKAI